MLQVGDRMPEFVLRNSKREKVTNDDLAGQVSVVAFYPMSFTGGCTLEMRGFNRIVPDLTELGAKVVGVSADTWATQGAFEQAEGLEFPLLSDWPKYEASASFDVQTETGPTTKRVTYVFDAEGIVRAVIDDERDMEAHSIGALAAVRDLAG
jgi:peroxiredoxin